MAGKKFLFGDIFVVDVGFAKSVAEEDGVEVANGEVGVILGKGGEEKKAKAKNSFLLWCEFRKGDFD